jgi:hypothetical protein
VKSPSSTLPSAQPRWATPATPGRDNLAGKVEVVARALGFPGLMAHQRQIIAVGTEVGENGLPAYRQVVIEEPRQQGKSIGTLSLMVARARDVPGTMISWSRTSRTTTRKSATWSSAAGSP